MKNQAKKGALNFPLNSIIESKIAELFLKYLVEIQLKESISIDSGGLSDRRWVKIELLNKGNQCIPLIFSIIKSSIIDLFVGNNKVERFCMDDFKTEEDLLILEKELRSWLQSPISEVKYKSGDIFFINSDTEDVIFASKNLFSFLWKKRIKERTDYLPWISPDEAG